MNPLKRYIDQATINAEFEKFQSILNKLLDEAKNLPDITSDTLSEFEEACLDADNFAHALGEQRAAETIIEMIAKQHPLDASRLTATITNRFIGVKENQNV